MTTEALVLVVDDDGSVRIGLGRTLRAAGHAVEVFEDARRLLDRLPTAAAPCCVVSDTRMPGMDGLALQQEFLSLTRRERQVFAFVTARLLNEAQRVVRIPSSATCPRGRRGERHP